MVQQLWSYVYSASIGVLIGLGLLNTPLLFDASQGRDNLSGGSTLYLPAIELVSRSSSLQPNLGAMVPPPQTLAELADHADLILMGTVGPAVQYLDFCCYDWDGTVRATPTDPSDSMLSGMPVTDLLLEVEQVIRDNGAIASGEPIILRIVGFATAEYKKMTQAGEFPLSYTGDRHLFLLTLNPDGKSYGLAYGPWSRLIIDGDILHVSNGEQHLVQFGEHNAPVTLDEFIKAVKGE